MSAYSFKLDIDEYVVGAWRGKGPAVPVGTVEVSEADYQTANGALRIAGTEERRWKYIAGALAEQPDTRVAAAWSPNTLDLDVGDAAPDVTLTLSVAANVTRIVEFDSGHKLRLTFVAGVATLSIPTTVPRQVVISSSPQVRLTNRLRVRILGTDLYPL